MRSPKSIWFHTYSAEALQAWRSLKKRKEDSPLVTAWFVILLVVFIGMILAVTHYSNMTDTEFLAVEPGSIILLVFFLFIAKSLANTNRRVLKQEPLVFYLSQPHHTSGYLMGLLCGEIMFNLGLLALVSGVAYAEALALDFIFYPNPIYFAQVILAIIAASILGFVFAIFNAVHPLRKRIALLAIVSSASAVFYIIIDNLPRDAHSVLYMSVPLVIASLALAPAFRVFQEAWNWSTAAATGTRRSVYERTTGKYAPKIMRWVGWESSLLLEKEFVERIRSREVWGSCIAIAAVSFASIYSLGKIPDLSFIPDFIARMLPPMVVGMGLFVGTILEPGMAALGAFGKDGKGTWVMKNAPMAAREVVKAKALGSLYTVPLLAVFAGALPALWGGYSALAAVFAAVMAVSMGLYAVGVGIWLGAKTPNFDPSVKGYPDIVTIYIYAMLSLGVCFFSTSVAFFFILFDGVLGILVGILMADLGALFLYMGIEAGAKEFRQMESP